VTVLTLKNISKSYGALEVLSDVSFTVTDATILGLVGANGAGKTTLLRIITGEQHCDHGSVNMPSSVRMSYLEQETNESTTDSVWELMLSVFHDAFALEEKMRSLEHDMHEASQDSDMWDKISHEYEQTTAAFEQADGYGYKSAIRGVLTGLGLYEDVYDQNVTTLSGGQRSRLYLAKMLLEKPDLLLLDEPTNHLDTTALSWLETYLKAWKGAIVIVSHDRWFLDQLCNQITQIERGTSTSYKGNYTAFIEQRQINRELQMKAYDKNQIDIKRHKQMIERYKSWGRQGAHKSFIKATAKQRELDKMERIDKVTNKSNMKLNLSSSYRGGNDVLSAENLSMSFDDVNLFNCLHLNLFRGDKAALIGANGIGKTTLLRILANRLTPVRGTVTLGSKVTLSYYDQLQQSLNPQLTIIEQMREEYPAMDDNDIRNCLGRFLFYGDDIDKKISTLSGGEKGRLSLLIMMLSASNLLLLDEPTNHLDMDSREILEDALMSFEGTVLFVSHDRYFINKLASRVLEMSSDTVTQHPGNWDDYLQFLEKQKIAKLQSESDSELTKTAQYKQRQEQKKTDAQQRAHSKFVKQLEADIVSLEQKLESIEHTLSHPDNLDDAQIAQLSADHEDIQNQIDTLMHKWESAHE
jgi:ATP-binding cassette, subfamily F, member 3